MRYIKFRGSTWRSEKKTVQGIRLTFYRNYLFYINVELSVHERQQDYITLSGMGKFETKL